MFLRVAGFKVPLQVRNFATSTGKDAKYLNPNYSKYLIIGAGNAGVAMANLLPKIGACKPTDIRVLEPNVTLTHEPSLDLVPIELAKSESISTQLLKLVNEKTVVFNHEVTELHPDKNIAITDSRKYEYDYLVLATGTVPDYSSIKGLNEALDDPVSGVFTTSDLQSAKRGQSIMSNYKKGHAIFYNADFQTRRYESAINQALLFEEHLRNSRGTTIRNLTTLEYVSTFGTMLPIPKNSLYLNRLFDERAIAKDFGMTLVGIDKTKRVAEFKKRGSDKKMKKQFDMLFVAPPYKQSSLFQKSTGLLDDKGSVDINRNTLIHNKYSNVAVVGHCTGFPTIYSGKSTKQTSRGCCGESEARLKRQGSRASLQ